MPPKRGAFIVVEGLDRSGKTTQTTKLFDGLTERGKNVKLYKFPDRSTNTGKMIDSYLRSQSELDDRGIHLLFSANRWEAAETMIRELEAGTTIIADRYAFSGIAFSAAKALPSSSSSSSSSSSPSAQESPPPQPTTTAPSSSTYLTYEWCRAPDRFLPSPDLVLFLDISESAARTRGGYGSERYEKEDLQRRVRTVFKRIASEFSDNTKEDDKKGKEGLTWVSVDAGQDLEDVSREMWTHIEEFVDGVERPIGRLWADMN